MLFADTYESIAASFDAWIESSQEGELSLEYANRAQDSLLNEAPRGWDYLTKYDRLTLGGTSGLEATLPADIGVLLQVYSDTDEDGKPDYWYYRNGEIHEGFRFLSGFTKAAGHSTSIQFYMAPLEPLFAKYQARLEDFDGEGTEYSFFPKNLVLRKMQHLRCLDKGLLNEWKVFEADFSKELELFKDKYQNIVEAMELSVKDSRGRSITMPGYSVNGVGPGRRLIGKTNDQDLFRR
jgi:hypothetical protein